MGDEATDEDADGGDGMEEDSEGLSGSDVEYTIEDDNHDYSGSEMEDDDDDEDDDGDEDVDMAEIKVANGKNLVDEMKEAKRGRKRKRDELSDGGDDRSNEETVASLQNIKVS